GEAVPAVVPDDPRRTACDLPGPRRRARARRALRRGTVRTVDSDGEPAQALPPLARRLSGPPELPQSRARSRRILARRAQPRTRRCAQGRDRLEEPQAQRAAPPLLLALRTVAPGPPEPQGEVREPAVRRVLSRARRSERTGRRDLEPAGHRPQGRPRRPGGS